MEEKNIKELLVDQPKEENTPKEDKGGNSFYEGGSKQTKTKWTKDWRAKALGVSIAALVLIGAAIPSGMAMSKYFEHYDMSHTFGGNDLTSLITNEINSAKDRAVIDRFDKLNKEGYLDNGAYNSLKEKAKDAADKKIKDEKASIKKQYGSTWKEEWSKELNDKGFSDENEYKDSIMSDRYVSIITPFYNTKAWTNIKVTKDEYKANGYTYHSSAVASTDNEYRVIANDSPGGNTDKFEDGGITSGGTKHRLYLTPQNLVAAYLDIYKPISLNQSPLDFVPTKGSDAADGTPDITADTIKITQDNLKMFLALYNALEPTNPGSPGISSFKPDDTDTLGIKSLSQFDMGNANANFAIYSELATSTSSKEMEDVIRPLIKSTVETNSTGVFIDKLQPDKVNSDQLKIMGTNLVGELKKPDIGLIESISGTPSRKSGLLLKENGEYYISYLTTEGLKMIGLNNFDIGTTIYSDYGKNLINDSLDIQAGISNSDIVDTKIYDSYSTWVSNNIKDILLLTWINDDRLNVLGEKIANLSTSDNIEDKDKGLEEAEVNYLIPFLNTSLSFAQGKYKEADDFINENDKLFNKTNWDNISSSYIKATNENNHIYEIVKNKLGTLLTSATIKENTILTKGDEK